MVLSIVLSWCCRDNTFRSVEDRSYMTKEEQWQEVYRADKERLRIGIERMREAGFVAEPPFGMKRKTTWRPFDQVRTPLSAPGRWTPHKS